MNAHDVVDPQCERIPHMICGCGDNVHANDPLYLDYEVRLAQKRLDDVKTATATDHDVATALDDIESKCNVIMDVTRRLEQKIDDVKTATAPDDMTAVILDLASRIERLESERPRHTATVRIKPSRRTATTDRRSRG